MGQPRPAVSAEPGARAGRPPPPSGAPAAVAERAPRPAPPRPAWPAPASRAQGGKGRAASQVSAQRGRRCLLRAPAPVGRPCPALAPRPAEQKARRAGRAWTGAFPDARESYAVVRSAAQPERGEVQPGSVALADNLRRASRLRPDGWKPSRQLRTSAQVQEWRLLPFAPSQGRRCIDPLPVRPRSAPELSSQVAHWSSLRRTLSPPSPQPQGCLWVWLRRSPWQRQDQGIAYLGAAPQSSAGRRPFR